MKITIVYAFGIFVISTYVYTSFICRTMKKDRYKYRIIASVISLIIGYTLDSLQVYDRSFGSLFIYSGAPLMFLLYYKILGLLLKPWIGKYPYSPFWNKIGEKVKGEGYPSDRIVNRSDIVFGELLLIAPIVTLVIIGVILK